MNPHDEPKAQYMSLQQIATRWDFSDRTVRRIPRQDLPYSILASSRRYLISDVEEYERHGALKPTCIDLP